ncbi:MAG: hypothetical protein ACE37F_34200 [Nannocystaceae bacterium]|nr:hypothetical protein [bacterium]
MLFPDHLLCPPLGHVAARLAGEREVAVWTLPGWEPSRLVRRVAAQWPTLAECPAAAVVVLLTELPGEQPSTLAVSMAGRVIVEMAALSSGTLGSRLFSAGRRSRAVHAAVERFGAWREAGLLDAEQWVSTKPADTLLTVGRLPAPPRSGEGDGLGPRRA